MNDRPSDTAARYVVSRDGSRIAYEAFGSGPAVILVGGALNDRKGRASGVALAQRLGARVTAIAYDRRGRGASTATAPYHVEREIDDIAALVAAHGGSAALYGMSSGGALVLAAAAAAVPVTRIALYDPPFSSSPEEQARATSYHARLQALLAASDSDGALALFLGHVGMPAPMIAGMRSSPAWAPMAALGPTLAQDSAVLDDGNGAPVPVDRIAAIAVPILVMVGEKSPPLLQAAGKAVAAAARHGSCRVLAGQTHDVSVDALAPPLIDFLSAS
jgi:pimeloyl-ACP methyl ester carboxylesterase